MISCSLNNCNSLFYIGISNHLKGQLGPPPPWVTKSVCDIFAYSRPTPSPQTVCVCLCVTKNEHFFELPPLPREGQLGPPVRLRKSSLPQEGPTIPLGLVALWPSSHKLLIRPPFIVHQTKWLFEQMPLSSQGALFEMEQMAWWWITSAKCTFTRIWLLSCRSDLLPSTYLPLRYQVTHTLVWTSLDRITFVVSGIM